MTGYLQLNFFFFPLLLLLLLFLPVSKRIFCQTVYGKVISNLQTE